MLAMANKNGYVFGSEPGLANRARVPLPSVIQALEKFMSPDEYSRTKDFDGRRIEKVDGGWRLLNYLKHRSIRDEEDRREYMRSYMREYRNPVNKSVNNVNPVSQCKPKLAQAEAEAEAEESNPLASQVEEIYETYPRKTGKRQALKAINAAIKRVENGEYKNEKRSQSEAIAGIKNRTAMFAQSSAGRRGQFTPHPATWFNRSSYLDDPKSWDCEEPEPVSNKRTRTEQRVNDNRAAILAGLGLSREDGRSQPDLQNRDAAGGNTGMEKLLRH
jgi:hypothetical protein